MQDFFKVPVRVLMVLCWLAAPVQLRAETPEQGVKDTILSQIEAFAIDDAEGAWQYASDAIKKQFPSPTAFMAMVRARYPAVYRAGSIEFREFVAHAGFVVQNVRLRGPDGRFWDSAYTLTMQEGGWRIGGVVIRKVNPGI